MRRGVRLAVDVGTVRVGVARSDPDGVLAVPLETLRREPDHAGGDEPTVAPGVAPGEEPQAAPGDIEAIARFVTEWDALEVLVGLPLRLGGGEGTAAEAARRYAVAVARRVPVGVRLVDERLSTVTATRSLRDAGRRQRRARPVVDQAAAVVFLQSALDAERASGRPPGELVGPVGGRQEQDGRDRTDRRPDERHGG